MRLDRTAWIAAAFAGVYTVFNAAAEEWWLRALFAFAIFVAAYISGWCDGFLRAKR